MTFPGLSIRVSENNIDKKYYYSFDKYNPLLIIYFTYINNELVFHIKSYFKLKKTLQINFYHNGIFYFKMILNKKEKYKLLYIGNDLLKYFKLTVFVKYEKTDYRLTKKQYYIYFIFILVFLFINILINLKNFF